jgi:pyruvate/2-oxoglutarate dehydrogenase complex dihydrolipoamide dehydrogenase (E3) component
MTGQIVPRPPSPASDVLVIGAGPAGAVAALRAADLGARTVLVTSSIRWHGS